MPTRITGVSFSDYAHFEPLPKSAPALSGVLELFDKLADCAVDNSDLLKGGDDAKIRTALATWVEPNRSDTLLLFWAGHGILDGDHFLACSNSPKSGLPSLNALRAEDLGDAIAKSGAARVLVVLDTCHSGAGAAKAAAAFASVLSTRAPVGGVDPTISIISSCHALEKAVDGRFFGLMKEVLETR